MRVIDGRLAYFINYQGARVPNEGTFPRLTAVLADERFHAKF
jgi:hypothetical protein